jgi:hypothetical protein
MLTLMLVEMNLMMQETKEGSSQVVLTQVLPDKMHQRQQATLWQILERTLAKLDNRDSLGKSLVYHLET